jgi:hypothetical protein
MRVSRSILAAVLALLVPAVAAQDPPVLSSPGGGTVDWLGWLAEHGRTAVVLWASWTPGAKAALEESGPLDLACREAGLSLVLIAVQEPIEDSRRELARLPFDWLHDRHGSMLKRYRQIRLPTLVVVGGDGTLETELPVSAAELRRWSAR